MSAVPLPELNTLLRAWLRDNLILQADLVDPHRDDVRISLLFKDDDEPIAEAIVWMPEKW